jgi:hypothetical protein
MAFLPVMWEIEKSLSVQAKWLNFSKDLLWIVWWCFFNATFNNISVISWWSVLLVEETGGPRENHRPVASPWQTLSHNVVQLALIEIQTHSIVVIGTDCIGSSKSNYHTIMATTAQTKTRHNISNIYDCYWLLIQWTNTLSNSTI